METKNMIFVFGSNEGGFHGAGAAAFATRERGAVMGVRYGLTGQSFAIPTKDKTIHHTLSRAVVRDYVEGFKKFAHNNLELQFQITRIGCGLAGYDDSDIAPMFLGSPDNCFFDTEWKKYLGDVYQYWGSF